MLPDPAWNNTSAPYPENNSVHELFEAKAAEIPDKVAISYNGKNTTYQELNNISNQLARSLQAYGIDKGSIVGCYLSRNSAAIVCLLAILKTGAAYVLLDSNLPAKRLEYILADSGPSLVIADRDLPDTIDLHSTITKNFVSLTSESYNFDNSNLAVKFASSAPAYIAYTSGSTGKPKGVVVSHRSTVNHGLAFSKEFNLVQDNRIPLMSSMAFDMAIEEIIPPLISGCCLIISDSKFKSMEEFTKGIELNRYTLLNIPSSLWHEWTTYLHFADMKIPQTLQTVIVGSEPIDSKILKLWQRLKGAKQIRWAAAYGTTETTVTSTIYNSAESDDLSDEPFVPIGKPIANTVAYILDKDLNQVDIESQGELYIGGAGLALGYLNKPDLTKQKFVKDVFSNNPENRLYKTGDIARYRNDGNIVWVGRSDFQIKLRGLRIEPEEIEAIINNFSEITESVVVAKKYYSKEQAKLLVAYVIIEPGKDIDEKSLIYKTAQQLPKLMVPTRFIKLDKWPLNSNGKIDRHVLENMPLS